MSNLHSRDISSIKYNYLELPTTVKKLMKVMKSGATSCFSKKPLKSAI